MYCVEIVAAYNDEANTIEFAVYFDLEATSGPDEGPYKIKVEKLEFIGHRRNDEWVVCNPLYCNDSDEENLPVCNTYLSWIKRFVAENEACVLEKCRSVVDNDVSRGIL